ncbi:MAG: response regulator [candidate division Zixibacteria bacterium]|nr:response regulator [Candidatus Tariuqbacter arcticus]
METKKILWVDDEIDLLKSHIMFLGSKGYDVIPAANGDDAIELVRQENFDVVLLDEMMPGRDGLSTLVAMKEIRPDLPVIMITKNEEETLMEEAIGSKIDDYLTKPVNPSQILMALKKIIEGKKLSEERLSRDYVQEFQQINLTLVDNIGWQDWIDIHVKLTGWEVELDRHPDMGLQQSLEGQRETCNGDFSKFIEQNYRKWMKNSDRPPLSVDVVGKYVFPLLKTGKNVLFLVVDCMRMDQWLAIEDLLGDFFNLKRDYYYSILPTATPYARNALFAGLFPAEIEQQYKDLWQKGEEDESSSNRYERQLMENQLASAGISLKPEPKYIKILDSEEGVRVERKVASLFNIPLISIVINFVDILAHSRASSDIIKEMVPNESAYRSIVRSWFEHSSLFSLLKTFASRHNTVVVMTSDHGSVRVQRGTKVISDRDASTNLRYKHGRNLKCDRKHALFVKEPTDFNLPQRGINANYIIAKEDYYFIYPTNYNKYLNYFRYSFQHGGVSLEEMILPIYTMERR